jgi:hypothetical protein
MISIILLYCSFLSAWLDKTDVEISTWIHKFRFYRVALADSSEWTMLQFQL